MLDGAAGGVTSGARGVPGGGRPSLRAALGIFENRAYRWLWLSSLASFTGMNVQMVAQAWLAWELSRSFTIVGLVSVSMGLPMLCFSLIGGAMADRVNKRSLALLTQAAIAALAFITAALVITGVISVPWLFVLGLGQGTAFAFGMPARQPLMASVVGREQLMSAMAMGNAAMSATRLLGPALAGAIIAWQGVGPAYLVYGAMSVLAAALLLFVPHALGAAAKGMRRSVPHEIADGIRYVARTRVLRLLLLMTFIPALFAMPYQMLLAGFVERDLGLGPDAFGFLQTVAGVGAVVGSIAIASLIAFPRKPLLQLGFGVASGGGLVLLGIASVQWGYAGAIGATLLLGVTLTAYQTLNMTLLMHAADAAYYGRVMSIVMLTFSVMPLMGAPLGLAADLVGATNLFIAQGVTVAALLLLVSMAGSAYVFGREPDVPVRPTGRLAAAEGAEAARQG